MAPSNILTCVSFWNLLFLEKMGLLLSLSIEIIGDFNFIYSHFLSFPKLLYYFYNKV